MEGAFGVVLLAAGLSRRFGDEDKLCVRLGDGTLLGRAIDNAKAAGGELIVVCRPDAEAVHTIVAAAGARWVANASYANGMGTSIACGVSHLSADLAGIFICLGDMPYVEASDFADCKAHFASWRDICRPTYHGQPGHPVLFGSQYRDELAQLTGDHGARDILERYRNELRLFPSSNPGTIRDIDRPADLAGYSRARG